MVTTCEYGVLCLLFTEPSTSFANCTDEQIRLVGGGNDSLGRVEVCFNNAWGTVCNSRFGTNEAKVICRQLGFSDIGEVVYFLEEKTLFMIEYFFDRSSSISLHYKFVWSVVWSNIPGQFGMFGDRTIFV